CATTSFATGKLPAPGQLLPVDGAAYLYDTSTGPPRFTWMGAGGAKNYELRFFERDASGHCADAAVRTVPVTSDPCSFGDCAGQLDGPVFTPPIPSGYCWDVTGIADDGTRSESSPKRQFVFIRPHLEHAAPGVTLSEAQLFSKPGPL